MSSSRLMVRRGDGAEANDDDDDDANAAGSLAVKAGADGGEGVPDVRRFCSGDGRKTVLFGFFSSSSPVIGRFP
jgi:hypothetical protein